MTKKLYITTAIPYANAKPHIGNALDYLYADIWSRYQKQGDREVRFQIGTDEHGSKIAAKAAEANLDPKTFVDQTHVHFRQLADAVGAEYTDFIRTTDPHHIGAVQYIWQQLQPHIYKGVYEGWYCVGCENFVTDKEATANNGVCPDHQTSYSRISEENYYLRSSSFSDQVREAIETNKLKVYPEYRKREFLELIKDGLQDVSISRPRKNLSWGVPVPGDDSQVMYVWIDALSNYLTILGYPDQEGWRDYWPSDLQIIGKDIMRFHLGIWPVMLLALGLPLPKKMLVHGFVSVDGTKMSKTIGNVVDPMELLEHYGRNAFRYYFTRHISTQDDGDFSYEKFENAYNNELGNDLGNLVQRIAVMVSKYQSGVVGDARQAEHDMKAYHEAMDNLEFNKAIDEAWVTVHSLNRYIERIKPWEIAKNRDTNTDASGHLEEVLGYCVGAIIQIGDMLQPFMPEAAQSIHDLFESGVVADGTQPLFPKIYRHTTDSRIKS